MLLPPWIILAVLGGLTSNAFNYLSRFVLKDKQDPVVYTWYLESVKFIIFASIAIFDWKLIITPYSLFLFSMLAITEGLGAFWLMKMHSYSHLSISTILSRTRIMWVPVFAFLLLGEALTIPQYIGILILFVGLSIVIAPNKLFVDKGALYANLAAFMIALNWVFLKMSLPFGSASVLNALMLLPLIILLPILFKNVRRNMNFIKQEHFSLKSIAILFNVLSIYFTTWALAVGQASTVTALYQSMMVFSVLAGIIFLKEREDITKKLIGTAATLIGVFLLTS